MLRSLLTGASFLKKVICEKSFVKSRMIPRSTKISRKTFLSGVAGFAGTLIFSACAAPANNSAATPSSLPSATSSATASSAPSSVGQPLKVGANVGNVPWEFEDKGGQLVGFEVDLVNEVGKRLNRKVEFVNTPFTGLFPAISSNRIDAAVSSITITPKRLKTSRLRPALLRQRSVFNCQS